MCNIPAATKGGKPFPGTAFLGGGSYRCALCVPTILSDMAAGTFYNSVYTRLGTVKELGFTLEKPAFELLTREALRKKAEELNCSLVDPLGFCYARVEESKGEESTTRRVTCWIFAETGQPQVVFVRTVAHELGHALQYQWPKCASDSQLVEGFAEWVAYKVLSAWGKDLIGSSEDVLACMETMTRRYDGTKMIARWDDSAIGLGNSLKVESTGGTKLVLKWAQG